MHYVYRNCTTYIEINTWNKLEIEYLYEYKNAQ